MTTVIIFFFAVLLIAVTFLVHYEALRVTSRLLPRRTIRPRQRVLVVITMCFAAHLVEISLYAMAYAVLHDRVGFGSIQGDFAATALDFFYFSLTSYTTLGIGDVYPKGPIRVLVGIEALNGFVLITWSASFTYLMMQRYWHPERDG